MRLIDANGVVKEILKERDKIHLTLPPASYEFGEQPNRFGEALRGGIRKALRCVEEAPTIDAVPMVHGRWMQRANGEVYCSHCNCNVGVGNLSEVTEEENYCYNCGAKMDGDE